MAQGLQFAFQIPTSIAFGIGSLDTVGARAKALGMKKPLIVTDKIMGQTEAVGRIKGLLHKEGIASAMWDGISAEPTDKTIQEGLKVYRAEKCDSFIGYGGGSSMDTAKCIGVLALAGEDDPTPYQRGGTKVPLGCPPVIAIPTTAGTGSEVTSVGVFTSSRTGHKLPIAHPTMYPRVAIVDPSLMVSMPPKVTMATGIDALSHAVECFTQVRVHPFSDTLGLEATRLIASNLKKAIADGSDLDARSGMALAAVMAGTAFAMGGLQFHAYAQAIGAKYHAPHGITCGVALRGGLRYILPKAPAKLARLCWAFGIDSRGLSEAEAAKKGVDAAVEFINSVGIGGVTEATGATRADIPWLVQEVMQTSAVPVSKEDATALWEEIFKD